MGDLLDWGCLASPLLLQPPPTPRRLISGMHSSISAHIVGDYLLDQATDSWGRNLEMFRQRLGNPGVRDRVENL